MEVPLVRHLGGVAAAGPIRGTWEACRQNLETPEIAMRRYIAWLRSTAWQTGFRRLSGEFRLSFHVPVPDAVQPASAYPHCSQRSGRARDIALQHAGGEFAKTWYKGQNTIGAARCRKSCKKNIAQHESAARKFTIGINIRFRQSPSFDVSKRLPVCRHSCAV